MRTNLEELKAIVASYVNEQYQANPTYTPSNDNLAGLVNKIAATFQIDGLFQDKLPEMDGFDVTYGRTIEEYFQNLGAVLDKPSTEANAAQDALKPYYPSYEDPSYNYSLGKKIIPTTVQYNDYERGVKSEAEYNGLINTILKRLYDLYAVFKYGCKRQILGNAIDKAIKADKTYTTGATAYTTNSTVLARGTRYSQSGVAYLCIKTASGAINKTLATLAAEGEYVVALDLVTTIAKPVDSTTGEAFLVEVKKWIEKASDVSQATSFNGAAIGVPESDLMLVMLQGIKPSLDVDTEAGAFNPEKLGINAVTRIVPDFGNDASTAYAILFDARALKLHPNYMAVRTQDNGAWDFINYFLHSEHTAFIGRNQFIHVFKAS